MQCLSIRRAVSGLLLGFASLAAAAQTIDFETGLPDLYFDGQAYTQSGFTFTQIGDFGALDTAAGPVFFGVAPSGNDSQFYSVFNDTAVSLTRGGGLFSLSGFDAGFILPLSVGEGISAGQMVVSAVNGLGQAVTHSWDFGLSDAGGTFAFLSFGALDDFSAFSSISSAVFSACLYSGDTCVNPADNLAQFAIDNVHVMAPVPEPETYALMAFGLAALAYRRRRQTR